MLEKILVVDDEKEIADLIEVYLQNENMDVYKFYSGEEALVCIGSTDFDLAILDIMLPDISGLSICQSIRSKEYTYPVIMLSAKDGETDKITGLTLGADDYITKPFDMEEVLARIESNLRRVQFQKDTPTYLRHGDLILDLNDNTAFLQGSELTLTAKEFAILELLMKYPDKIFSKANLFQSVWNIEYISEDNTLNVHISNLRNKLKAVCPDKDFIDTVWGIGYRLHKARD